MKEQLLILLTGFSQSSMISYQFATCSSHVLCLLHAHRPPPLSLWIIQPILKSL